MKTKLSLHALVLVTSTLFAANVAAHEPTPKPMDNMAHDATPMPGMAMTGKDASQMHSAGMKGHSAGSMELHKAMSSGMKMPMEMSGNVDKDFAIMMTMHHQQAVKMANVMIKQGRSPELKALATKMKKDQMNEIKQMKPYTK